MASQHVGELPGMFETNVVKQLLSIGIETSVGAFSLIFSFLHFPGDYKCFLLRRICKTFSHVLKPPSSLWTSFPHPNYSTLNALMDKLNEVYQNDIKKAPTLVFIMEGNFHSSDSATVFIRYPMKLIGAGRNKTILSGYGFQIQGSNSRTKESKGKKVELSRMSVCESSKHGLYGNRGLFFLCDSMNFTRCGGDGVVASCTKGRLINCVITQCGGNGIYSQSQIMNAIGGQSKIELEGSQTKVQWNGTNGLIHCYGLKAGRYASLSLLSPLKCYGKGQVSTNNRGRRNYYHSPKGGSIRVVTSFSN
jgi:hypothetical protein